MYDPLGLSIGTTNLVAARAGSPPVTRRSVLTLFPHRGPEVGVLSQNPALTEPGMVITGFVERVGDPIPLVAADGSTHDPDLLLVEAIDVMINAAGSTAASAEIAIAIPAYWGPRAQRALRDALRTHAELSRLGIPPRLVSDAVAGLTALNANAGLAARGVVALLDFGGSGTNITLADGESDFEPIDETLRYREFSGDQIDQALLVRVLDDIGQAGRIDPAGTAATAAVEPLAELREECRQAKERLSTVTATELVAAHPEYRSNIPLTRAELENLIQDPLSGVISALEDMLQRNKIAWSDLAAVATVGGGASIRLITRQLSSHVRVPVVTTPQPAFDVALGAALLAARGPDADAQTSTAMAAAVATSAGIVGLPAGAAAVDDLDSTTLPKGELAWSQEVDGDEPVPFTGGLFDEGDLSARPDVGFAPEPFDKPPRRSYRLPLLIFGLGALVAMIAIGVVAYTLSSKTSSEVPPVPTSSAIVPAPTNFEPPPPSPASPPPSAVPPPTSAAPPPPPPPATTRPPAPRTTTTIQPTTTTTTTATTPPPPTTTTTTSVPMTTDWLTIPFVPIPIPVPVPGNQAPPPENPFLNPGTG